MLKLIFKGKPEVYFPEYKDLSFVDQKTDSKEVCVGCVYIYTHICIHIHRVYVSIGYIYIYIHTETQDIYISQL